MHIDELDRALLRLLLQEPRAGMRAYARVLGIARGTVQSRLARLERHGVIADFAPHLDVAALGYPVLAFVYLHVAQGHLEAVVRNVGHIREVLEAHTIAGEGDIHCRVVARDNSHLEQVIQQLIDVRGVVRTKTEMALRQRLAPRILPLVMEPSNKLTSSIAANT
jgi:DNA-binding Lrp family transcriptional regulator